VSNSGAGLSRKALTTGSINLYAYWIAIVLGMGFSRPRTHWTLSIEDWILRIGFLLVAIVLVFAPGAAPGAEALSFPKLAWSVDERVPEALRVFPAPADPEVVFVASAQGLWRTRDDAATWQLIPRTGPDAMGTISHLAVCPARPDFVVLASREKGVFISEDGGTAWRPAGGVEAGLAGPSVVSVTFPAEDRAWLTLLACHGDKHPGISKSADGGRTWRVLSAKRYFRQVVSLGITLSGVSSVLDEPDNWALVCSQDFGENWRPAPGGQEGVAACATATRRKWVGPKFQEFFGWRGDVLWGMQKGRLLLSQDIEERYEEVGPEGGGRWASVFATPGPDPEVEWLWAYDPYRTGLVCASALAPRGEWQPNHSGLPVASMTRRGANAAANADGTAFYACANLSLYIGRHVANDEGPTVRLAKASPAALVLPVEEDDKSLRKINEICKTIAADKGGGVGDQVRELAGLGREREAFVSRRRFNLRVQVSHPKGPGAVKAVEVVPDLFGLPPMHLSDDGAHGDGRAQDGVWGGALYVSKNPHAVAPGGPRRRWLPGVRGLPVTAVDDSGNRASWTLMLGIYWEPAPFVMWDGVWCWGARSVLCEGQATVGCVRDPGTKTGHIQVKGQKGPWTMCWAEASGRYDITGLKSVAFELTGSPGAGDVAFCLVDGLDRFDTALAGPIEPNFPSRFVPLLDGHYLATMDGKPHTVRIPLTELTQGIRFMRTCVAGFGLRARENAGAGTYDFGRVWFEK